MKASTYFRLGAFVVFLCLSDLPGKGQQFTCPNGEKRLRVDLRDLSINYNGLEMVGTLGRLQWTGIKLDVKSTTLQQASAATQQWNEYLKGFAIAWNKCVITKAEYNEALQRVFPQLQTDATALARLQEQLAANHEIDQENLNRLLETYTRKMQRFADISRKSQLFDYVTQIASDFRFVRQTLESIQQGQMKSFADIEVRIDSLSQQVIRLANGSAAVPGVQISTTGTAPSPDKEGAVSLPPSHPLNGNWSRDQPALRLTQLSRLHGPSPRFQPIKVAVIANTDTIPNYLTDAGRMGTVAPAATDVANRYDPTGPGPGLLSLIAELAPNARLIPIKAFVNGITDDSTLLRSMEQASQLGARIILMPFIADSTAGSPIWDEIVRRLRSQGIIMIAPAGNNSTSARTFPAALTGVLSVASVDTSGRLAEYSNFGEWVSLAAPGEDVIVRDEAGKPYAMSGTSVSSAIVAGVAALALGADPMLSPDQLESVLRSTARPIVSPTVRTRLGGGIVDAFASTTVVLDSGRY